jgi:hypothetical protein
VLEIVTPVALRGARDGEGQAARRVRLRRAAREQAAERRGEDDQRERREALHRAPKKHGPSTLVNARPPLGRPAARPVDRS